MKYTIKLNATTKAYEMFEDDTCLGTVELKNYPVSRDPSGHIWKLPKNALGREWLTYNKLANKDYYELTEAHKDRGIAGATTTTSQKNGNWIERAQKALTKEEFETLQSLVNKVNAAGIVDAKRKAMEDAKAAYTQALKDAGYSDAEIAEATKAN